MTWPEEDLLPLSALVDIVFCERRAALHLLEQMWTENAATAEGHHLHDKVHAGNGESRSDIRIARGVRLRSLTLGISGIADVVEFHRTERADAWRAFPVEYKRGILRHEQSFEIQLCAQALCLEEMLNCSIPQGALFYGISRRRQCVIFDAALRGETTKAASRLHELVTAGRTPPAIYSKKCEKCSLVGLCLPRTAGRGLSATAYLESQISNLRTEREAHEIQSI